MTPADGKTMAIIRRPRFGVGDRGTVVLSFATYISECSAADQYLTAGEATRVIEAYGVSDVVQLDGKPCWVDRSGPSMIRWVGPLVISP